MGAYARWRGLTKKEQRRVLTSAAVVVVMAAGIRVLGVRRMLRSVERRNPTNSDPQASGDPTELGIAVDRAGRYVPGGSCLPRSLALAWMLRRRGVTATVRVGVRTADGFEAHAWVECNGIAVDDAPRRREGYAPLVDSSQFTVDSSKEPRTANRKQ